jgi:hypothetical protein
MLRVSKLLSLPLVFAAVLVVAGCQKPADKSAPKEKAAGKENPAAAKAGDSHPSPLAKGEGTGASLPKGGGTVTLSAEDLALIAKQKVCPVTGAELGSMGDPVKVVVKGQTVFLCCAGCEDAIKKDPDKYLAKLKDGAQK